MKSESRPTGRRERAMADKRRRIMDAARSLFALRGVDRVTTQQVADEADVAIGTLFRYAASKAELLIMIQNEKFADAIDEGQHAATCATERAAPPAESIMALLHPVISCIREHPANGRLYLHELTFGDPAEQHRAEGLAQTWRLESSIADTLHESARVDLATAATLARVVTAIIHVTMTASLHLQDPTEAVIDTIHRQISIILPVATVSSA